MVFVTGGTAALQTLNNSLALHRRNSVLWTRRQLPVHHLGIVDITSLPVGYLADEFGEQAVLAGEGIGVVGVLWLLSRLLLRFSVQQ